MSVTKEKGPLRMFTQCVVYKCALLLFCLSTCLCMLFSHKTMWFACVETSQYLWFILTQSMRLMPIWDLVFCRSGSFGVFFSNPSSLPNTNNEDEDLKGGWSRDKVCVGGHLFFLCWSLLSGACCSSFPRLGNKVQRGGSQTVSGAQFYQFPFKIYCSIMVSSFAQESTGCYGEWGMCTHIRSILHVCKHSIVVRYAHTSVCEKDSLRRRDE